MSLATFTEHDPHPPRLDEHAPTGAAWVWVFVCALVLGAGVLIGVNLS